MKLSELQGLFPEKNFVEISLFDPKVVKEDFLTEQLLTQIKRGDRIFAVENAVWLASADILNATKGTRKVYFSCNKQGDLVALDLKCKGKNYYHVSEETNGSFLRITGREPLKISKLKGMKSSPDLNIENKLNLEEELHMAEQVPMPGGVPFPTVTNTVGTEVQDSSVFENYQAGGNEQNAKPARGGKTKEEKEEAKKIRENKKEFMTNLADKAKSLVMSTSAEQMQTLFRTGTSIIGFATPNAKGYTVTGEDVYPDAKRVHTPDEFKKLINESLFIKAVPDEATRAEIIREGKITTDAREYAIPEVNIVIKATSPGKEKGAFVVNLQPFMALSGAGGTFADEEVQKVSDTMKNARTVTYVSITDVINTMLQFGHDIKEDKATAIGGVPGTYGVDLKINDEEFSSKLTMKRRPKFTTKLIRKGADGKRVNSLLTENNYLPVSLKKTIDLAQQTLTAEEARGLTLAAFKRFAEAPVLNKTQTNAKACAIGAKFNRLSSQGRVYLTRDENDALKSIVFAESPAARQLAGLFKEGKVPASIPIQFREEVESEKTGKLMYRAASYSLGSPEFEKKAEYREKTSIYQSEYSTIVEAIGQDFFKDPETVRSHFKSARDKEPEVNSYEPYKAIRAMPAGV